MASDESGDKAPLHIDVEPDEQGVVVLKVAGELDISNVSALERRLDEVLASPPDRLVFDLSQLRFLDSSGIGVLLRTTSRVASVQVHQPSEIVRQVVDYMGLTAVLGVEP